MDLSRKDVIDIVKRLREAIRYKQCLTYDCLQGLLTQLEIDAQEDVSDIIEPLKVPPDRMHGCLGCEPCPPGEVYADYLRRRNNGNYCGEKEHK
ncbi:MAG: hypothetical protein SVV80_08730 [Planctomycetota bacterium]|nr:hypothetical protein [Planctomycetota bacterium]